MQKGPVHGTLPKGCLLRVVDRMCLQERDLAVFMHRRGRWWAWWRDGGGAGGGRGGEMEAGQVVGVVERWPSKTCHIA